MSEQFSARLARVVVAAAGDDTVARTAARALLMSGSEVVYLGDSQSIDQVAHSAIAEDAGSVVFDAPEQDIEQLRSVLESLGRPDVRVRNCGE